MDIKHHDINGIILCTQTPASQMTYHRPGATGFGIHQVTGFDIVKMHRENQVTADERQSLTQIKQGSIIHITGHGSPGTNFISANYRQRHETLKAQYTLKQYVSLLMNNTKNLRAGDKLKIVLWTCYAGAGGSESTAAQLGRLFLQRGIKTDIICSTTRVKRFRGNFSHFNHHKSITFNAENIRIFKCRPYAIKEYATNDAVYFNRKYLINPVAIQKLASYSIKHQTHRNKWSSASFFNNQTPEAIRGHIDYTRLNRT